MHTLRCVLAEWQLVRARLVRTRLGLWLLLLGAGLVWLGIPAGGAKLVPIAVLTGALSAVLTVAFGAGSALDRAALAQTLAHPTTPCALATGRWLGATGLASCCTLACVTAIAWAGGVIGPAPWRAAIAGIGAAGATAACALPAVWLGGNALATALFLYLALLSGLAPAEFARLAGPGPPRAIGMAILEAAPSLWRYERLAAGDPGAWLHAAVWTASGLVAAGAIVARRGR